MIEIQKETSKSEKASIISKNRDKAQSEREWRPKDITAGKVGEREKAIRKCINQRCEGRERERERDDPQK